LARALLVAAEEAIRQRGARRLFAEVSLAARLCFESRGFVVEREEETECRGQRIRRFIMSKSLA
jgi:putative acetyltransferase